MQMYKEGVTIGDDLHGWPQQVPESLRVYFVFHAFYHIAPPKHPLLPLALMSLCQFIS